ncbi:MAG TPA: cupin domain-containing protein [Burkholderiales bacterium]|jgi:uncharacterized cupin superfamily protein|nr:cupin domain-containing protein [Burkholderiales bacterium]
MYLSAEAIAALEGVRKVHYLNADAQRINKSLGDAAGLKNIGVHLISVPPGHPSTEFHAHHYEEECIFVLSGRGRATIGDASHRIGPGDFIGCPANGVAHEMINDGAEPLVCLVMGQRLQQDITDYPRLGKRLYRHSGEWDLVDLARVEHPKR